MRETVETAISEAVLNDDEAQKVLLFAWLNSLFLFAMSRCCHHVVTLAAAGSVECCIVLYCVAKLRNKIVHPFLRGVRCILLIAGREYGPCVPPCVHIGSCHLLLGPSFSPCVASCMSNGRIVYGQPWKMHMA